MKNIIIILIFAIAPIGFAQSLFEKYEDMDNVSSVVVNQKMFGMLAEMQIKTNDPEADTFLEQVKTLKNLTVYTTDDLTVSKAIISDVDRYIKSSSLEELMRIKDGDKNIKFYVQSGRDDNHVSELLMLVNGLTKASDARDIKLGGEKRIVETILLSLTGDIDLRNVSKLTTQLNLPGGEQLKKASKITYAFICSWSGCFYFSLFFRL